MTQSILNLFDIRQELLVFLRNKDIISTANRGVTNVQDTGTFASDSSHLINRTNVKNIRSITRGSLLVFGTDYTVEYYFNDSGTRKCKITFAAAQTGSYSIDYDYGTDKIWADFPRDDLSINSYPRIAVDILSISSDAFGIGGNEDISNILFTVVVYGQEMETVQDYITDIRKNFLENRSAFFYIRFIKPVGLGPLINDGKRQEIMS